MAAPSGSASVRHVAARTLGWGECDHLNQLLLTCWINPAHRNLEPCSRLEVGRETELFAVTRFEREAARLNLVECAVSTTITRQGPDERN